MSNKLDGYSPQGDKVRRSDGTLSTLGYSIYEGVSGGNADGVVTEKITIPVGTTKAFYFKSLKEARLIIGGYMHSVIDEAKFSAIESYILGNLVAPSFGPSVIDLMVPREVTNTMDDTTATVQIKQPFSQDYNAAVNNIFEMKMGNFLLSDAAALTDFINLPTTEKPLLLVSNTLIAPSQTQGTESTLGAIYFNVGQELLLVLSNPDTGGTNEATADVHITLKYSEVKF